MEMTGHYDSEDGQTNIDWSLPDWSDVEHAACRVGAHIVTRKVVVTGFVGFSLVKRAYCACGRKCWIWFEDGWAASETTEPGAHLQWVERFLATRRTFALHRKWEQAMSDQHPCWGEYRKCISCGCSVERPCVSHVGRPDPGFTDASTQAMARARARQETLRQETLRQEMWPK